MGDDDAYMALVTDNSEGELSSIEKAIHCFEVVGVIETARRSGNLANYAKATGMKDLSSRISQMNP